MHCDVYDGKGLMRPRQAVLGLVSRTASWPQRIAAWVSSGAVQVAVSYCESVAHLQARLGADRGTQVVLLDGDLSLVDRDLLTDIATGGGVPVVVEGRRRRRDWVRLGAAEVLPSEFDRAQLLRAVGSVMSPRAAAPPERRESALFAVTGPGGTGASVTAIALSQGLAVEHRRVLLADCCLHAEQAMLHNAHGSQPGLSDVVDLHAERTPDHRQIRRSALGIVERGYYLLPGLPRARHWSRIRAGSLQSALRSLRTAFDVVVADVDPEVEGEAEGGSIDVEERNVLARTVLTAADVVLVVGQPTMKGIYAMVRTMVELLEFGIRPQRLLPVVNQSAAPPAARAELSRTVRQLINGVAGGHAVGPALFAPTVALDEALRERDALPGTWSAMLAGAATTVLGRRGAQGATSALTPIAAGSLGHWDDADDER